MQWMPSFEVPGDDAFFTYSVGDELSHVALFHDIGDSVSNARRADVLFIGNSRMPLGLREDGIVPAAEVMGSRVFSLGMGHSEGLGFALELIRRHDLRPKVVVVAGGPHFFGDRVSDRAVAAMQLTWWQAHKLWIETRARWGLQRWLHTIVPKLDWFGDEIASQWVIYRSSRTGWWRPAVEPAASYAVGWTREDRNYDRVVPAARELQSELRSRGALMVVTLTPYAQTQTGHLPHLGDALGVPVVLPDVADLATSDGSHLNRDSGERFARAFWRELIAVPAVREKLSLRQGGGAGDSDAEGARYAVIRAEVEKMRSMLEDYYGGPDVLRKTWYLQPNDRRYQQGIDFLADKLARALVWRDRFVIGTIGSSVTAGFDNCHYDSYQLQLERLMAPVWNTAGVEFEVRNTGQGGDCGDSFDNQVWCLRTLVGDDVDMTHYSWTYFEAGSSAEDLQLYHELFYRWSLLMERSPVPQILYTHDCSRLPAEDQVLLDVYGPFGADVLCMERGIKSVGYPGKEWGVVGDTLHETTREGEAAGVSERRRQSLGVVFRNWHPGPLLFQTTADALAYKLSDALLLALGRVSAEPYPTVRWPKRPRQPSASVLPKPLACPAEWCAVSEPPRCTNYEVPTFGEQHFARLDAMAEKNPHRALAQTSDAGWTRWKAEEGGRYIPDNERSMPECRHPAACAGLVTRASQQAGWLTFSMPQMRLGFVAVCCSKKKCGQAMLEAGVKFLLDGKKPASAPRPIRNGKCVEVQPRFAPGTTGELATVHIGIRLPALAKPIPAITHVIGL